MIFGRELLIGIALGLLAAWAYQRFAVPQGAPVFPVIVSYDRIGQAVDRMGIPFLQQNPSR